MSSTRAMAPVIPCKLSIERADRLLAEFGKPTLTEIAKAASEASFSDELMILGGSLGLGLGNEKSDIDVLLVNPGVPARSPGPFQFFADGERIEIVRIDLTYLRSVVRELSRALGRSEPIGLPHAEARLLSRVAHGCRMGGPPLDAGFESALARTCHLATIQRSAESARQHGLVAALALEQEDELIASWNARGAIEAILQRDVLRSGLPYAGSKWLTEQLAMLECGAAIRPLLQLPRPGDRQAYLTDCLAVIADSLDTPATIPGLGETARWDTAGLGHYHLPGADVLVQQEHNAVIELAADAGPAWAELSCRPEQPIGGETRSVRDVAWQLYVRGLAGIRWENGGRQ